MIEIIKKHPFLTFIILLVLIDHLPVWGCK